MSRTTTVPPAIATLSRFSRIHAMRPRERPSIASPLTPARIASGAAADSGVISSGAAMLGSISRLILGWPAYVMAGPLALPLPEDVSVGTRSARGQRGSFCDCDLITILPSQRGHDLQSFLLQSAPAGQIPRRPGISR